MQTLQSIRVKLNTALEEYANACLSLSNCHEPIPVVSDLASDINTELEGFAYLKSKTTEVETILRKTRNSLLPLVPISSLPDEILTRIFRFVHDVQSLQFERLVDSHFTPVNILTVSQVCARWRQAAFGSGNLWSRIDLTAPGKAISLGEMSAIWSANLPLHIRIVEPFTYNKWQIRDFLSTGRFDDFMLNFGSRIRSLEFSWIPRMGDLFPFWFWILDYSLCCSSDTLTRFTLSDRNIDATHEVPEECFNPSHWFLVIGAAATQRIGRNAFSNHIVLDSGPLHHYEEIFSRIKSLKLDLVYPFWTSKAYHGLTELRLTGPRALTNIMTTQELANILQASPDLRVFHFGLEITPTLPSPPPISLQDLEVFLLQSLTFSTQQAVLRLLLPGTKPLQMSTTYNDMTQPWLPASPEDEFSRFFKRSNIVQLQVHSSVKVEPRKFLELLPDIQSLIFRKATILEVDSGQEKRVADICPNLHSLHFISCTVSLDAFSWVVSEREMFKVSMWDSAIICDFEKFDAYTFADTLTEFCPVFQLLEIYEHTVKVGGWGEDIEGRIINAQRSNYETQ
ncbi:unnamed protein product [Rhizoctonia solani]|uniref:F-box domain-containing protein n=1 Tax=Rhizoctonia solani TaxID=456999 RepID=A0A8H2WA84_9AGAM|nr:unnamed protein product [Rhizoctonia solani]